MRCNMSESLVDCFFIPLMKYMKICSFCEMALCAALSFVLNADKRKMHLSFRPNYVTIVCEGNPR